MKKILNGLTITGAAVEKRQKNKDGKQNQNSKKQRISVSKWRQENEKDDCVLWTGLRKV